MIERIYNKAWYIGEREGLGKCKESSSKVWGKTEYRDEETRKVEHNREKRL